MPTRLSAYSDAELRRIKIKIFQRVRRDLDDHGDLATAFIICPQKLQALTRIERVRMERDRNKETNDADKTA